MSSGHDRRGKGKDGGGSLEEENGKYQVNDRTMAKQSRDFSASDNVKKKVMLVTIAVTFSAERTCLTMTYSWEMCHFYGENPLF